LTLSFSLTKWYMDVVSEDGEAVSVQAAELHFAALHLHYASVIHSRGLRVHATSSLRKAMPTHDDGMVTWSSRALDTRATWQAEGPIEPAFKETILKEEGGSVEWRCVMPLARAEVTLDGGRVVRGLGYVEELRLDLAPWTLPIEELRWGHFAGEGASIVWLDWRGPHQKRVILKNGVRAEGLVTDGGVELTEDETRVQLDEGRVLREGTLGGNALAALAELAPALPAKILATTERLMCAPAVLEQPFMTPVKGWAIYASVRWP
jgi:hypothetical protein